MKIIEQIETNLKILNGRYDMGTNYYLMTKDKNLAHDYFATKYGEGDSVYYTDEEYTLTDIPDFHYIIHLNKLSCGWRPLFQRHKTFSSFAELEQFYTDHTSPDTWIEDEYHEVFTWEQYKQEILDHANVEPKPVKWVYEEDKMFGKPGVKYLQTKQCEPEEADLWVPFNHVEKYRSAKEAQELFKAWDSYIGWDPGYSNDPDYPIDWTDGEFS
jgi:hypothetical protein